MIVVCCVGICGWKVSAAVDMLCCGMYPGGLHQ